MIIKSGEMYKVEGTHVLFQEEMSFSDRDG